MAPGQTRSAGTPTVGFPSLTLCQPCIMSVRLRVRQQQSSSGGKMNFFCGCFLTCFCSNEVLHISGSIDDVGGVQWDLMVFLVLAWIVVYGVIWKGLHNSGKVRNYSFDRREPTQFHSRYRNKIYKVTLYEFY